MQPYEYHLLYGKDSPADEGMVMFKLTQNGQLVTFMQIPREKFLDLAHSVRQIARAVESDLYGNSSF